VPCMISILPVTSIIAHTNCVCMANSPVHKDDCSSTEFYGDAGHERAFRYDLTISSPSVMEKARICNTIANPTQLLQCCPCVSFLAFRYTFSPHSKSIVCCTFRNEYMS
jgi:hypothetical protein